MGKHPESKIDRPLLITIITNTKRKPPVFPHRVEHQCTSQFFKTAFSFPNTRNLRLRKPW